MKKLPIICLLVMMFTVGTAHAQPHLYEAAPCGTKGFTTTADVIPNGTICLDIYLFEFVICSMFVRDVLGVNYLVEN